jgi:hypothetical protein
LQAALHFSATKTGSVVEGEREGKNGEKGGGRGRGVMKEQ